jgi:serine/threonine protein kinase
MKPPFVARGSLAAAGESVPLPIATAIVIDALEGLHAAHEARTEEGQPLRIVHRDVSPQNILIGADGVARVLDFGIAHAAHRLQRTMPGQIKGKAAYMAPEQARGDAIDRRVNVYAAAVLLWEILTGSRLFQAETFSGLLMRQMYEEPPAPSSLRADVPPALDQIILRGLAKNADGRFATAREMVACHRGQRPTCGQRRGRDLARARRGSLAGRRHHGASRRGSRRARRVRGRAPSCGADCARGRYVAAVAGPPAGQRGPAARTSESPGEPQASASTSSSTVSTVVPHAPSAHRSTSTVSSVPSVPAVAPSALPMCCVNQLQIRYHDCVDNCPR